MPQTLDLYDGDRIESRPLGLTFFVRRALGVANIVVALVIVVALTINITDRVLQGIFDPTHYFQYFTVQTCILNIAVLLVGGIYGVTRTNDPHWYVVVRASIVSYAVVVGVVYNVLLAGLDAGDGYVESSPFPNLVEHVWVPIFIAIEWLLMPGRSRIGWSVVGIVILYPLAWVAFSLARGLVGDGWFPYFFLNVTESGGSTVAMYVSGIAVFIIAITAAVVGIGHLHSRVFEDLEIDRDKP